ncbi:MAG TPA: mobilome CxxCx(11)CxxC protein [Streptosporangiaceae bacterium]|nr:mobilome CxxCx(11)CxxC protein [Streptosporangiaceae bacterium]
MDRRHGIFRKRSSGDAVRDADRQALALRSQCWNDALNAYATSYIFQRRARLLGRRIQWVTYVGFAVPMTVGLLVLSYNNLRSLPVIVAVAAAIGVGQTALSLWAIIGGWVGGSSYAVTSAIANDLLAARYTELASNPPGNLTQFQQEYRLIKTEDQARTEQDYQQGIKEAEKRLGMRAALRRYQRQCAGCGKVPVTMTPTNCGVCGNFRYRIT